MDGIKAAAQGRLGGDPELRFTSAGKAFCSFSIAVEDRKADRDAPAEWLRVVCWEALAEQMAERLEKGAVAYVEGRIRMKEWEGGDGQRRTGLDMSAWVVQPIGQIGRPRRQEALRGVPEREPA